MGRILSFAAEPVSVGLVANWKLNGNAFDLIGGNHGRETAITYPAGKLSQAADFNGTSSLITTPGKVADFPTGTICAWIRPNGSLSTGNYAIYGYGGNNNNATFYILINSIGGTPRLTIAASDTTLSFANIYYGNTTLVANTWYFVTFSSNGTSYSATVNNVAQTLTSYSIGHPIIDGKWNNAITSPEAETTIGALRYNGSYLYHFPGLIDEVGVWNRPLTSTEITYLYNGGTGLTIPTKRIRKHRDLDPLWDNLLVQMSLDGNGFEEVNGNNGSLVGAASFGTGKNGQGLVTAATSGYMTLARPLGLIGNASFSCACWIKTQTTSTNWHDILGFGAEGSSASAVFLYVHQTTRALGIDPWAQTGAASTVSVGDGNWHFVGATFNSATGSLQCYVDGLPSGSATTETFNFGNTYVSIGRTYSGSTGHPSRINIDDVYIWGRGLSAAEMANVYNIGVNKKFNSRILSPLIDTSVGLLGDWHFDGNLNDSLGLRNMTATSGTPVYSGDSKFGQSLDNTSGSIIAASFTPTPALANWTYNIWIKPSFAFVVGAYIFNNVPHTDSMYMQYPDASNVNVNWFSGGPTLTSALTYGNWYMVTLVKNGTNATMYVNGVVVGSATNGSATAMVFQQFGYNGFSTYLSDKYDRLNIWNRSLPAAEIVQMYNRGAGRPTT